MDKKKTELIITIVGVTIILITLVTICYFGIAVKRGEIMKTAKYGTVTMSYVDKNIIAVSPMKPMTDEEALESTNYFAFQITSKSKTKQYIYFDPLDDNTLDKKYVKVALTVCDGEKETIIGYPKMVLDFDNYAPEYGYLLYSGDVDSKVEYRFRIWIDIDSDPKEVENTNYKVKIKAYGAA